MELRSIARLYEKYFCKKFLKVKKMDQNSIIFLLLYFFGLISFRRVVLGSSIFHNTTFLKKMLKILYFLICYQKSS